MKELINNIKKIDPESKSQNFEIKRNKLKIFSALLLNDSKFSIDKKNDVYRVKKYGRIVAKIELI